MTDGFIGKTAVDQSKTMLDLLFVYSNIHNRALNWAEKRLKNSPVNSV